MAQQGTLTRGVYEFEDPVGTLLAAKVPYEGTADLFSGTRIIVRPNQAALFVYNGKLTEVLLAGNHEIQTENFPLLTRLANWRFGFESPLRCEIWFISLGLFTGRHWGTANPVMASLPTLGTIPIRAHGNFNLHIRDAKGFYLKIIGAQGSYDVSEIDTFIQGQILEFLPKALTVISKVQELNVKQAEVAQKLEALVNEKIRLYGMEIQETQVLALVPPQEVLEALDEKLAMDVIGDKKDYLLYKVANSLDQLKQGAPGVDHTQLMMSLMMGRSLLGGGFSPDPQTGANDSRGPAARPAPSLGGGSGAAGGAKTSAFNYVKCPACMEYADPGDKFCPHCGNKL